MHCPGRDELTRFLVGDLPGPAFQRLLEHVEACASCSGSLQALEEPQDPLLSGLHGVAEVEEVATMPLRLTETARALKKKRPAPGFRRRWSCWIGCWAMRRRRPAWAVWWRS